MRMLALFLFSINLAATAATAQVSNGTVPVPSTLAGQNVGAVNGRSSGFGTAGISAPQSPICRLSTIRRLLDWRFNTHRRRLFLRPAVPLGLALV